MTCDPNVVLKADYHYGPNYPEPYVKLEWQLPTSNKSPVKSSIVRYSQIDVIHNNHPLGEFNATVLTITNDTSIDLMPFLKSPETLYSVQICVIHDNNCPKEPKWEFVPRHPVYMATLISALPPPIVTTTTTTEAPTTPRKAGNGTRPGAPKKDNSTVPLQIDTSNATVLPVAPEVNQKPAIDNMVAIVTTPNPATDVKPAAPPGGSASTAKITWMWVSLLLIISFLNRI